MKILKGLALALALAVVTLGVLYVAMAERVEVVVLHSHGEDGEHETRLWVVDDAGHAWLRTGASNATWLPRIRSNPDVELERSGQTRAFRATVVDAPESVARIDELMLAKYGWSEELLRASGADAGGHVAIRLEPREP